MTSHFLLSQPTSSVAFTGIKQKTCHHRHNQNAWISRMDAKLAISKGFECEMELLRNPSCPIVMFLLYSFPLTFS